MAQLLREHLMLFGRTQLLFSAPTLGRSQLAAVLVPGFRVLSAPECTYIHTGHIHKNMNTFLKAIFEAMIIVVHTYDHRP